MGQAGETVRLAQLSYRAGKSSLIELLDAQQAYASTQAELIAARRARAEAQATLARQAAAASEVDLEKRSGAACRIRHGGQGACLVRFDVSVLSPQACMKNSRSKRQVVAVDRKSTRLNSRH